MRRYLSNLLRAIFNRYESGQWGSKSRSYLQGFIQDINFDLPEPTRQEIVRKSRYWERNDGIYQRALDVFEQFTTGPNGLAVIFQTPDENWNASARDHFAGWSEFPDIATLQSLGILESLIARSWFVDGEIFILKTKSLANGIRPRIQLIETHRVATPDKAEPMSGNEIIDGIEIDKKTGRAMAYWMSTDFNDQGGFKRYDANEVIHVFEPVRPGQLRGIPFCYAVLDDLHDLHDLQILEKQAAKENARIAKTIETASGEFTLEDVVKDTNTKSDSTSADKFYKNVFGSETQVLRPGEKYQEYRSERPSASQQWHWDYLTSKFCIGVGVPKIFVLPPSSGQGTITRADLESAAMTFRSRSAVMQDVVRKLVIYVIGWGINQDSRLSDPPANWPQQILIRPPRSANVDVGRNSTAIINEWKAGLKTMADICSEAGADWALQLEQRAKEAALIKSLSIKYQITPSDISDAMIVDKQQQYVQEVVNA